MSVFFLILIFCVLGFYVWKHKLVIRFDTLFRKGFRKRDDNYGIFCWVGKQGHGKSYSVADYLNEVRGNRKVITNQYGYYESHKDFCIYENDFWQIIDKFNSGIYDHDYIIFYDELFGLVEKGQKLPKKLLTFISQLRKRHIYIFTTVQEWLDVNVTFRRYVRYEIDCSMRNILFTAFCVNTIFDGYQMKWSNEDNEYVAPVLRTTIKKASKLIANSYDTDEVIVSTQTVSR